MTSFADGFWKTIFSPVEWALVSRWNPEPATGITVLNVYIPAHTRGFDSGEILLLRALLEDLVTMFPGDIFVVGGDFNIDLLRDQMAAGAIPK
jgi:hypothetical protein